MLIKVFLMLLCTLSTPALASQDNSTSLNDIQNLINQGNSASATQQLKQLTSTDPNNFQAWFLLGVHQAEQRQFKKAILAFKRVIALQPKLAEPHNNLAVIYNETGNYRAAVSALEASLTLKPGYATAQENIGDLYIKLAADAYRKVLSNHNNPVLKQRYQRLLTIHSNNSSSAPNPPSSTSSSTYTTARATPAAPTTAKPSAMETRAALNALEDWRQAWSSRDLAAYFSAYSEKFQYGQQYPSLAKWRDYKTWAMRQRSYIQIDIEDIVSTTLENQVIKLEFLQHFKSDNFNSDNQKSMLFEHTSNGWKIIHEASM